jgi:hypothetical protein
MPGRAVVIAPGSSTRADDRRQHACARLESRPQGIDLHDRVEHLRVGLAHERSHVGLARPELSLQRARDGAPGQLQLRVFRIGASTRLVRLCERDVGGGLVCGRLRLGQVRRQLIPTLLADGAAVDQALVALERRLGEYESCLRTLGLRARSLLLGNRLLHAGVRGIELDAVLRWIHLVEHIARLHHRPIGHRLRLQPPRHACRDLDGARRVDRGRERHLDRYVPWLDHHRADRDRRRCRGLRGLPARGRKERDERQRSRMDGPGHRDSLAALGSRDAAPAGLEAVAEAASFIGSSWSGATSCHPPPSAR